ncbi:Glycerol dehydrogenase [Eubacteriaceae bacterium CHKCI004]|nr:Glycerol dehydrogenase [Eubacteriaceae bacterium CHKCI004]
MSKIICSPGEYIQGKGEMKRLADYYESADRKGLFLVKGAYMIVDSFFSTEQYKKQITESFQKKNITFSFNVFGGECCMKEIEKHKNNMDKYDMVIGIGGGKTLDTAKAVSFYAHMPVMIVPTAASSDAPCSRLAVIYKEDGTFEKYLPLRSNPDMVIMDTEVIAKAPVRFLVAGIGDALATCYEAEACEQSGIVTMAGGQSTRAAIALSQLCREILFEDGLKAKIAVEENVSSKAVENRPFEEIVMLISFCKSLGLPTTFKDLNLSDVRDEALMSAAQASCDKDDTMGNMPFTVTPEDVFAAMKTANRLASFVPQMY